MWQGRQQPLGVLRSRKRSQGTPRLLFAFRASGTGARGLCRGRERSWAVWLPHPPSQGPRPFPSVERGWWFLPSSSAWTPGGRRCPQLQTGWWGWRNERAGLPLGLLARKGALGKPCCVSGPGRLRSWWGVRWWGLRGGVSPQDRLALKGDGRGTPSLEGRRGSARWGRLLPGTGCGPGIASLGRRARRTLPETALLCPRVWICAPSRRVGQSWWVLLEVLAVWGHTGSSLGRGPGGLGQSWPPWEESWAPQWVSSSPPPGCWWGPGPGALELRWVSLRPEAVGRVGARSTACIPCMWTLISALGRRHPCPQSPPCSSAASVPSPWGCLLCRRRVLLLRLLSEAT